MLIDYIFHPAERIKCNSAHRFYTIVELFHRGGEAYSYYLLLINNFFFLHAYETIQELTQIKCSTSV